MPNIYGKPSDQYRALQVYNYLKNNTDIRVIYPYEELIKAKSELSENIFYKTDTHWNKIGGYIGATTLLQDLGITLPSVYNSSISIVSAEYFSGDLAKMLCLSKELESADNEYIISGYHTHNMKELEWNFSELIQYHAYNADPRVIYVIRDSFASNMAEYIGSQFNNAYLRHKYTYSYNDMVACNPDIVVYETVERYVDELNTFSIR